MKRENEEKEEKKSGSHNQKEHETSEEDDRDMLSELPDCILIHILSFLKAEEAVRTCILSSSWKHLWKHLPSLTLLYSSHFTTYEAFIIFVNQILSLRDSSAAALNALDFELNNGFVEPHVLETILSYDASLNLNHLRLSLNISAFHMSQFPSSLSYLSSCRSLTSLDIGFNIHISFSNSLNLPALTYLKLKRLSFPAEDDGRAEPFSNFNRLNTLILDMCTVYHRKPLCISSTTLLNLSIYTTSSRNCSDIELFAPNLCTFNVYCHSFQKLFGSHLSSIKQVSIDVYDRKESSGTLSILNWLTKMTNIKSLAITPTTLQALSLFPDIFKLKLTSWCNLKSLKLNLNLDPYALFPWALERIKLELASGKSWKENAKLRETVKAELTPRYSSILDGMIDFLLQNSPSAKVDISLETRKWN